MDTTRPISSLGYSRLGPGWRRALAVLLVLGVVAGAARLAAPYYLRSAINRRLANIPGYSGHVQDIDVQLLIGGYRIRNITIVKREGQVRDPFFSAEQIDFSVAWRELMHRRFVSDISIAGAHLNFVRGQSEAGSQLTVDRRWQDVINDLFPINITFLEVDRSTLRYADETRRPPVDIAVSDLHLVATGLRNRPAPNGDTLPARISLSGQTPGHGKLKLFAKLEPLALKPHLELNAEVRDVSLPVMNDFLRAFAKVDVSRGRLEVFGQLAMADGHYEGYIKPFLDRLDFKDYPGEKKDVAQELWEKIVAAAVKLVRNKRRDQFATRIPFSGDAANMDVKTWTAVGNALRNGFIQALREGFEGTTHPDSPRTTVPAAGPEPVDQATGKERPKSRD